MAFQLSPASPLSRYRTLRMLAVIALLTAILLKLSDALLDSMQPYHPALFPPGSKVRYLSHDFDTFAFINAFGFRGAEERIVEGQIVVVGDSFTFGFGNPEEDTWARILQNRLHGIGDRRAVYNLGVPGTDTLFHLQVAREALEYRPSVVVIAILLADDFQQVLEEMARRPRGTSLAAIQFEVLGSIRRWLRTLFPGWHKLYLKLRFKRIGTAEHSETNAPRVTEGWKSDLKQLIGRRSSAFPEGLRKAAISGAINPMLFLLADRYPDRSWKFWADVQQLNPAAMAVVALIQGEIAQLKREIDRYGGKLIVLSMPSGEFVESEFATNYRRYGAVIPSTNFSTLIPENTVGSLARSTGAVFVPSLQRFREHRDTELFFPTDGHLNKHGNRLIADLLFPHLTDPSGR